ncbi:FAD binding domain-containing protein [Paludisphaera mucosa]|uniref:Xanthine dehydrogenase family protein subunit M n=1 Tax=Paludisphaera mucosa TaxID=3030827 RepID=A0ABT6FCP3_9BACT|nr:xanthine dehydrogenase family protein subunit M [Paludisphaera mucosa]MDG3005331.1 xanthine dehydrogenase family protein subunit M [Paludisphaera mucosa]
MKPFSYGRADDVATALLEAAGPGVKFVAGGTNLLDLMKADVERPDRLVDVNRLDLRAIVDLDGGGLRLGALATNSQVAYDERVERRHPLLSRAILAGASPQLRNMATTGGNLLQRTRCAYFYDVQTPCNKREPGTGCPAIAGWNRYHAILGTSEHCIAVHPSDMCVALAALGAVVRVEGPSGGRAIPFEDFHRLPGDAPHLDANLQPGEIITAVDLPAEGFAGHFSYQKIRDRTSYAFALVSVAAALRIEGGTIAEARIALGGVAHKPWRDQAAEALLKGARADRDAFRAAADAIVRDARGREHNTFKIELARRVIVRALLEAAGGPQA